MATDKQLKELGISNINIRRARSPEGDRVRKQVEKCLKLTNKGRNNATRKSK